MAAPAQVILDRLPHQRAAVALRGRAKFLWRHPQRTLDAGVQRTRGVVHDRLGCEGEAQVVAPCRFDTAGRLPLVRADEVGLPPADSSTMSNRPSATTTVATVTSGCQNLPSR